MALRFDNRVVIVTGAGGGLGRAYALFLASRGAKVVVNDLGGSVKGDGGASTKAADVVVEEIRKAGGEAVANYDSVENGPSIVKTAVDKWGRVDVVINNAGILRDVSFLKMKDQDWELIHKVHVFGAYSVTKAAWPYMREQGYGRIIMTTSAAGLYGNHGQANYSAAKLALVGFSNTLAKEGESKNILCNAIAPVAGTRMTATVMPADMVDALKPDYIVPLVAYLCNEKSETNGGVFEVGAGWIAQVKWNRAKGAFFNIGAKPFSPEDVAAKFEQVTKFDDESTHPSTVNDAFGPIMANLERNKAALSQAATSGEADGKNEHVDVNKAMQHAFQPVHLTYTAGDVCQYALAVGMGRDPLDETELPFVYEGADEFRALPSLGLTFSLSVMSQVMQVDGLSFNPMMLLHGEQEIELLKPIPTSGTVTTTAKLVGIYDKGKGALVLMQSATRDESGVLVCRNLSGMFIRGIGGFGGPQQPPRPLDEPPQRAPDAVQEDTTSPSLAIQYRYPGNDLNPLHIDPNMSAMGGFKRPILHGLATFGFASRAVLKHFAKYDTTRIKRMKGRFTKHVFPGETIVTEMWRVEPTKIVFRVRVKEREGYSITGGAVELHPSPSDPAAGPSASSASSSAVAAVFEGMKQAINAEGAELVKKINGIIVFQIGKETWTVDLKNGNGAIIQGEPAGGKGDVTLTLDDQTFVDVFTGNINAQQAFMNGKLKIKGQMALAQKLSLLTQNKKAKL